MPFESGLIQSDDVLQIENVLYKQKENELVARKIFAPNNSYDSFAGEIGYDYYTRQGSAKIFSRGSSAKDIPFVGEKGGRVTQSVYDIYTGCKIHEKRNPSYERKTKSWQGTNYQH
jgi:hypothetical protein